jgi:hypothetical protein
VSRVQPAQSRLVLGGDTRHELRIVRFFVHGAATRTDVSHAFCRSDMINGS